MRFRETTAAAILATAATTVWAGSCSQDSLGNYYCNEVTQIKYTNIGHSGSYSRVSSMNQDDGTCGFSATGYSGSMAPFDEEVSVHIRGPFRLKNFAVYIPSEKAKEKRSDAAANPPIERRQQHHAGGHGRLHKRCGKNRIAAPITGEAVPGANDYQPSATEPTPAVTAENNPGKSSNSGGSASPDSGSSSDTSSGGYTRVGYYNAESGTAEGITFLGNYGGQGSGKFTYTFGNSLSYLNAEGTGGTNSPTVLGDVLTGSNEEYSIWTDKKCSGGECGFYQPGTVAYHGFSGADKVFAFEFSMPSDPSTGFNADMPALWILNALIPRTAQYDECSCWTSGCGEFDVYEILATGETRCKSTLHGNNSGGSSDWFKRPTDGFVKVVVVFDAKSNSLSIVTLGDDAAQFGFGAKLGRGTVEDWISGGEDAVMSMFNIS